jgi:hypothetical protein
MELLRTYHVSRASTLTEELRLLRQRIAKSYQKMRASFQSGDLISRT